MADDELALPFIFIADGADPPPELAAFKSAHPDWVSFPATFIPHEQPAQAGEVLRTQPVFEQGWQPPPRRKITPPQPARTDLGVALRAFQRASAEYPDPVTALRALRDRPEDFGDRTSGNRLTQPPPPPGLLPPSFAGAPVDGRAAWEPVPAAAAEAKVFKTVRAPARVAETGSGGAVPTTEAPLEAGIQLAETTTNPSYAAGLLGYDRKAFGGMIHRLKKFYGLSPSDNLVFHDNGDIYFGSDLLGNIHEFAA